MKGTVIGMTVMDSARTPEISALVHNLRRAADARTGHSRRYRMEQLKSLRDLLNDEVSTISLALKEDLGKSATEAMLTEIGAVRSEVDHAILHLTDWMEPQSARVPFVFQPANADVEPYPLGMVLIIAPWNFPFQLAMNPLVAAIAAGNTVVVKPSEKTPATSKMIKRLVGEYLDPETVQVVEGGAETTTELLAQKFDHIFYTGGERVGRIVYETAAKTLTPVTLELGGKSPCVVSDGRNWLTIARRIVFGKFANAGQTCIAPDYLLVVGDTAQQQMEEHLPQAVEEFYGKSPQDSGDYGRLVNKEHLEQLEEILELALASSDHVPGARLVCGGETDSASRYMAPTVISDVHPENPIMQDEIFGPILPIIKVDTLDEAMTFINERPTPLAAYLFTDKGRNKRLFRNKVRAGSIAFDVTVLQAGIPTLPFGGVGASGMGVYHGEAGFWTFSQTRSVLNKSDQVDTLKIVYPPYTWPKRQAINRLL